MERTKLSEIVEIQVGKTPSRSVQDYWGIGYDWLSIKDLNNLEEGKYVLKSKEQITEKAIKETGCIRIEPDTILFSFKLSIGKIAITRKTFYTNEAIAAFKIKKPELINVNYLFYALKTVNAGEFADQGAKGYTLNKDSLSSLLVPIVDMEQQNKIVAQLDLIQSIVTKRRKSLQIIDTVPKSIFLEMFGDPISNPKNIKQEYLKNLGNWQTGGTPPRNTPAYFKGNIPWYSSGELNEIYISKSKEKITGAALMKTSAKRIEAGSILLGMYDTAALKSSITTIDASCNQAVAFAKLDEKRCNSLYVYYAVQLSKDFYLSQRLGARQKNLNKSSIKNIKIPLPEVGLQKAFSDKVLCIVYQKSKLEDSLTNLRWLLKSFLHVSFRKGELEVKSDFEVHVTDIFLQQDLLDKIDSQDFTTFEEYQKFKKLLFNLLESGKSQIKQKYDSKRKKIRLEMI